MLQQCQHPNLVDLKCVVTGSKRDRYHSRLCWLPPGPPSTTRVTAVVPCSVFLVFEYLEHDLGRLLDSMSHPFHEAAVKCLVLQARCRPSMPHTQAAVPSVLPAPLRASLHQDLEPSNLLLGPLGAACMQCLQHKATG